MKLVLFFSGKEDDDFIIKIKEALMDSLSLKKEKLVMLS